MQLLIIFLWTLFALSTLGNVFLFVAVTFATTPRTWIKIIQRYGHGLTFLMLWSIVTLRLISGPKADRPAYEVETCLHYQSDNLAQPPTYFKINSYEDQNHTVVVTVLGVKNREMTLKSERFYSFLTYQSVTQRINCVPAMEQSLRDTPEKIVLIQDLNTL